MKSYLLSSVVLLSATAAVADVKVVADIGPVHSLVAQVMGDTGQPDLILPPNVSPHHYSLRPSQARALSDADVVFWIGEALTPWLEGPLEKLSTDAVAVELLGQDGLSENEFRSDAVFGDDHDDHDDHAGHDDHDDHGHDDHDDHGHDDHSKHDDHDDHGHDDHAKHDDHDDHGHDDHAKHDDHDDHGHGAHAFEWAGLFDLAPGTYAWTFAKVDGDYADPAMKMVVLSADDIEAVEETAEALLESATSAAKADGDVLTTSDVAYSLNFDAAKNVTTFSVEITEAGTYAFFTEHMPFEFEADAHFFKDASGADVEPVAQEPDMGHDDHHGHDHHDHSGVDPHAWLDPHNAEIWLDVIADTLSAADPENAATYAANAAAGKEALHALEHDIEERLHAYEDGKFVVFHDAYQYFEHRFHLKSSGAISLGDASKPSAARIAELQEEVAHEAITCAFSEPQFNPDLINTVFGETEVTVTVLDPLGSTLDLGADFYPQLLSNMADSFVTCLK